MAELLLGVHRLFGREVSFIDRDGQLVLSVKLPLVGKKEGPLSKVDRDGLRETFRIADARGLE